MVSCLGKVLAEDILNHDTEVRKGQEGQAHAAWATLHVTIAPGGAGRLSVDFNVVLGEIDQPGFTNAGATIQGDFRVTVKSDGGISDLNDQQDVGGARMASRIEIRAWGEERHVRLRL